MTKFYSLLITITLGLAGCSVSNVKHPILSGATPSDGVPTLQPSNPIAELVPEPVLVSEPMPVPVSAPLPESAPTQIAELQPSPVSSTTPETEPITNNDGSFPQTGTIVEGSPDSVPAVLLDPSNIVEVTVPASNTVSDTLPADNIPNSGEVRADNLLPDSLPATLPVTSNTSDLTPELDTAPSLQIPEPVLAVVDELTPAPAPIVEPAPNPASTPTTSPALSEVPHFTDDDDSQTDNSGGGTSTEPTNDTSNPLTNASDDDAYEEIIVKGSCLGKKNVGVILIDARETKNKKNKAIKCKSNEFLIKFVERKKDHPFLSVQTVFFN